MCKKVLESPRAMVSLIIGWVQVVQLTIDSVMGWRDHPCCHSGVYKSYETAGMSLRWCVSRREMISVGNDRDCVRHRRQLRWCSRDLFKRGMDE